MKPPDGAPETALEPGDVIDVQVEKAVYRGLGLARHAGQVVFVPRAWPGERLRVRVAARQRGYLRADPLELLASVPARRPSPCPYVPGCGGCSYQELAYDEQVQIKAAVVRESLARGGVGWDGELRCAAGPERGWRLRASLHLAPGPPPRLGLHTEGTHRVVDIEHCLQLSGALNRAARELLAALVARPERLALPLGGVELAESLDGERRVAALHVDADAATATRLRGVAAEIPHLDALGVFARGRGGRSFVALDGEPCVEAVVLGSRLRWHVASFFQSNRFLVEALARHVYDAVTEAPGGPVLDLYSGVGLFALPLAAGGREVWAAEGSPDAAGDLRFNARRAGVGLNIYAGDVRGALRAWPRRAGERIVLDPPRSGAGAETVAAVAARRPEQVVYVSCDPATLARDLRLFAARGYVLAGLHAFDLFPDTFHVECVARLRPGPVTAAKP